MSLIQRCLSKIKDCDRASEVWKRLEETYEGTPAVKSAKSTSSRTSW
jgi:TolA-binding protein